MWGKAMTNETMVASTLLGTSSDMFGCMMLEEYWEVTPYYTETSISLSLKPTTLTIEEAAEFDAIMASGAAKPKFDTSQHSIIED